MQKPKKKKLMVVGVSPSGQRGFHIRRHHEFQKTEEKPIVTQKQTA